ncbi:transmembrane protein 242-like, partial [Oppia nitens]|uniref:transmembrane protein 242-like n=1 Tax=Oppia nitens TaxID=1686743 RepID=UPI0023DCAA78
MDKLDKQTNETINGLSNTLDNKIVDKTNGKRNNKYLEMAFMSCVAGAGLLFGFSTALSSAKKKDVNAFDKGISIVRTVGTESGGSLAMRALLWGSVYACTGFGLLCFTVWKAIGVNDLQEFRQKVGTYLPRLTPEVHTSRTDFSSLQDLLQYIIDEDNSKQRSDKNVE